MKQVHYGIEHTTDVSLKKMNGSTEVKIVVHISVIWQTFAVKAALVFSRVSLYLVAFQGEFHSYTT